MGGFCILECSNLKQKTSIRNVVEANISVVLIGRIHLFNNEGVMLIYNRQFDFMQLS